MNWQTYCLFVSAAWTRTVSFYQYATCDGLINLLYVFSYHIRVLNVKSTQEQWNNIACFSFLCIFLNQVILSLRKLKSLFPLLISLNFYVGWTFFVKTMKVLWLVGMLKLYLENKFDVIVIIKVLTLKLKDFNQLCHRQT